MSDMELTPMSIDELKTLIEGWIAADTEGLKDGEVPPAIEEQYGEDPLAGVSGADYLEALDQLHEEGAIPDDAYEQAHAQIEAAGDDLNPQTLALNLTFVDNSIHTGDDFRGHISQGDTTTTNQTGNEGVTAGGDVYDSNAVTGDDNNVASGDYAEAGDGDDIDATGAHISASEGSNVQFGSGEANASNVDDHSWTDNSTNTWEDNDTDNSDNSYNDNSTNTDSFNSPYDSYNQDNDGEDIDDNDGYDEDYNAHAHVEVDVNEEGYGHQEYGEAKVEEYAPEHEAPGYDDDHDDDFEVD